jgi:hypothetical protein
VFKARTEARAALLDPRFPTRAPGLVAVVIDYDPVAWLRCPVEGEDRTEWHDRALTAVSQDWGLRVGGNQHQKLDAVLDRTADDPLSHTATFLAIRKPSDGTAVLCVDVADEEVTLLQHGDQDRWLAFEDLLGSPGIVLDKPPRKPLPDTDLRETSRTGGSGDMLLRAHRRLLTDPVTYLTAFGFFSPPKLSQLMLSAHQLVRSIRVESADA